MVIHAGIIIIKSPVLDCEAKTNINAKKARNEIIKLP